MFDLQKNKLVQLDIRDIDNKLIAPWDLYNKLRPGTVVLVVATLVTWIMHETEGDLESPLKKVCIYIYLTSYLFLTFNMCIVLPRLRTQCACPCRIW